MSMSYSFFSLSSVPEHSPGVSLLPGISVVGLSFTQYSLLNSEIFVISDFLATADPEHLKVMILNPLSHLWSIIILHTWMLPTTLQNHLNCSLRVLLPKTYHMHQFCTLICLHTHSQVELGVLLPFPYCSYQQYKYTAPLRFFEILEVEENWIWKLWPFQIAVFLHHHRRL